MQPSENYRKEHLMSKFRIYVETDHLLVINEDELTTKYGFRNVRYDESRLIENVFTSELEAEGFCLRVVRAVTGRSST